MLSPTHVADFTLLMYLRHPCYISATQAFWQKAVLAACGCMLMCMRVNMQASMNCGLKTSLVNALCREVSEAIQCGVWRRLFVDASLHTSWVIVPQGLWAGHLWQLPRASALPVCRRPLASMQCVSFCLHMTTARYTGVSCVVGTLGQGP